MSAARKIYSNGHASPNSKCSVDEAVAELMREANDLIEAVRARRKKREARSEEVGRLPNPRS